MNSFFLKIAIVFSTLFLTGNFSFFDLKPAGPDKYEQLWAEVTKLDSESLPKSAIEKVEEIYKLAFSEKNDKQIIK